MGKPTKSGRDQIIIALTVYASSFELDVNKCEHFLQNIALPKLNESDSKSLDEPISLQELQSALKCIKKGLRVQMAFHPLHFWDIIGPLILNSIHLAVKKGSFHRDNNTALISLIPKKGKGNF